MPKIDNATLRKCQREVLLSGLPVEERNEVVNERMESVRGKLEFLPPLSRAYGYQAWCLVQRILSLCGDDKRELEMVSLKKKVIDRTLFFLPDIIRETSREPNDPVRIFHRAFGRTAAPKIMEALADSLGVGASLFDNMCARVLESDGTESVITISQKHIFEKSQGEPFFENTYDWVLSSEQAWGEDARPEIIQAFSISKIVSTSPWKLAAPQIVIGRPRGSKYDVMERITAREKEITSHQCLVTAAHSLLEKSEEMTPTLSEVFWKRVAQAKANKNDLRAA